MRKSVFRSLLGLLMCCGMAGLQAQEVGHVKFIDVTHRLKLLDDLRVESTTELEYKVLTEEGARQNVRFPLSYNKALSTLEIMTAETIKADGRRIAVPPGGIARQSGDAGFMANKDLEFLSLAFPDLGPGDSAHLVYRQHTQPLLPDSFSFANTVVPNMVFEQVNVHLDAPEKFPLKIIADLFISQGTEAVPGRRIEHWRHRQYGTKAIEAKETDSRLRQPHVWISSFASWADLAASYRKLYEPNAVVTPEVAALARELTAGATSPREKAQRLYDWVRTNIRYVAIYAGLDNWVPRPAGEVLSRRFGDCKDHTVLLDALLRAEGIASVPVLLQADLQNYDLPETASLQFFNHMISYLPELDLYLDSSSAVAEFGRLPDLDQGKQVLRAGLEPALARTPAGRAEARKLRRETKIELASNGTIEIDTTLRFGGDFRVWFEQFRRERANGQGDQWLQDDLLKQNWRGTASLSWLPDQDEWRGVNIRKKIANFLSESEIGLLSFHHAYDGDVPVFGILDLFESSARKHSFLCQAVDLEETVEITLSGGLKLLRLPRDRKVEVPGGELTVAYSSNGNRHLMQRSFRWQPPGESASCNSWDWKQRLEGMRKMRSAVRSALLAYERS